MDKPERLPIVNHHELSVLVQQYVDFVDSDEFHDDNDYKQYIFEAAMETYYGKNYWKWHNTRRK